MSPPKLAIIGTAGRGSDQNLLTAAHQQRMLKAAVRLIHHLQYDPKDVLLFSGGAAWSDHIAVSLVILGIVPAKNLTLFLPTELSYYGFHGDDKEHRGSENTANTANYYHKQYKRVTGYDSLEELRQVEKDGATFEVIHGGFFARNSKVAQQVSPEGNLLAYTSGGQGNSQKEWTIRAYTADLSAADAGLKDGGTADTWNKAKCRKFHCRIGPIDENEFGV